MPHQPGDGCPPPPLVVRCQGQDLDGLLNKEWLLANRIGAYASSTVIGCNTRRYHGLLIATANPPVGRVMTLSTVMEQVELDGGVYELSANEFPDAFAPRGWEHLVEFVNDAAPRFVYRLGPAELTKEIMLADTANALVIRYTLRGASAKLRPTPLAAMRDYHGLRKANEPHQMIFQQRHGGLILQDRLHGQCDLHIVVADGLFQPAPLWWYRFLYRQDLSRGQDGFEDLYCPGSFLCELADGQSRQLTACLNQPTAVDFDTAVARRRERAAELADSVGPTTDLATRRLAMASDAFIVQRSFPNAPPSTTILAGYHWFADWGRDAFIALPGLLLETARFESARQVFRTFASAMSEGMIPNRFDDYSSSAHYNSIDASLWFIIAAERYVQATGDMKFWQGVLMPAANAILTAYHVGTRFDIRADADSLLTGGSRKTQLTWMDAALGDEVVTPRQGKAVEVNALWHSAHQIMARRCAGNNDRMAFHYAHLAELIGPAMVRAFWNDSARCLYDCITDGRADASIRPNQILAVSLPYSALSATQQAAVVATVSDHLLTPMGLRTLSPFDGRYRRRYGGSWESRDRAYHQGTVWAWLIGPFIEAYLKVNDGSFPALAQATRWLEAFDAHLGEAALGFINEIFDGDPPHEPRGCVAQAWSVAEVLRAKRLIARAAAERKA